MLILRVCDAEGGAREGEETGAEGEEDVNEEVTGSAILPLDLVLRWYVVGPAALVCAEEVAVYGWEILPLLDKVVVDGLLSAAGETPRVGLGAAFKDDEEKDDGEGFLMLL